MTNSGPLVIRRLIPVALASFLASCAAPPPESITETEDVTATGQAMNEVPVPQGDWREHRLSGCDEDVDVPRDVERYLGICSEYFRDGSGSDAMIEMEMGLEKGHRHSLMLLTLGQLYLMAGQGRPELLPVEGPAADTGDWDSNKVRLLSRARTLLEEARRTRTDDAAVEYLLADVARASGDPAEAEIRIAAGMAECTGGRSFRLLRQYQDLNRYPAKYLGGNPPVYPPEAVRKGLSGDVVLDLLLDPSGTVRQIVAVSSPGPSLARAAEKSLRSGEFEVARIGKYPVWSWLRVTTAFNLGD